MKTPPLIISLSLLLGLSKTVAAGQITVMDKDTKQPVPCRIYQESGNARTPVGQTNASGVFVVRSPGIPGQRYVAVHDAYNNGFVDCPVGVTTVYVSKTKFVTEYVEKANFHSAAGEAGLAALNFKKAADLARAANDPKARDFELYAAQAIADQLNVKTPYVATPEERTVKATPQFVDKVADFQRDTGLKANGRLTLDTYEKAAAASVGKGSSAPPDAKIGHAAGSVGKSYKPF